MWYNGGMTCSDVAVDVQEVRKRFGALEALDGVSLSVRQGGFFGLLGPNGAGKTTLIGVLGGLVKADSGGASILGFDVARRPLEARARIGIVPQEVVYDAFFTVGEALRFQSGYYGENNNGRWLDELLKRLHLEDKRNTNTRKLSGGMKRRLMIAQALVHRPPVIVLDEPTAGVDIDLRHSLWRFIRELNRAGHTIILTTHYLEEAEELCDEIALMRQGKIAAMEKTANLLAVFHEGARLRLKVDGGADALADSRPVEMDDGSVSIRMRDYADMEPLLAKLRESGAVIREMEVSPPALEDVFRRVMAR